MKVNVGALGSSTVLFLTLVLTVATSSGLVNGMAYPKGPNPQVTPGALCMTADAYRYPERIKYCNRDVATDLKADIIQTYDRQFGYEIYKMSRLKFKIDHYIPLCMGGANERSNLWPQHESVYTITDPLEALICEKMSRGRLKQADAILLIKTAKNNLDRVPAITATVNRY